MLVVLSPTTSVFFSLYPSAPAFHSFAYLSIQNRKMVEDFQDDMLEGMTNSEEMEFANDEAPFLELN